MFDTKIRAEQSQRKHVLAQTHSLRPEFSRGLWCYQAHDAAVVTSWVSGEKGEGVYSQSQVCVCACVCFQAQVYVCHIVVELYNRKDGE